MEARVVRVAVIAGGWLLLALSPVASAPPVTGGQTVSVKWAIELPADRRHDPELPEALIRSDGGMFVCLGDEGLCAISPQGKLEWRVKGRSKASYLRTGGFYALRGKHLLAVAVTGQVEWDLEVGGRLLGRLTQGADDTVYVATADKCVYAVSPAGAVIWRATIGAAVSDWDVGAGGLIYVLGADNKLYAITAQGQVKWITRLRGKYPGSVVEVREGTVYAVSGWDFPATRHAYVEAVSPDGGVRWTRDMGCLDRVVAVRSDGSVLVGCSEGSFYCLSPDGEIKWKIPAEGRGEGWWGQPVTAADGTMYLPGRNRLYAVTSAGEVKWERDFGGASPSAFTSAWRETFRNRSERSKRDVPGTPTPLIGPDGTVYVCAGHRVCALTPSGELKWKIETAEETETPLIGADGMLYVCAYNTVYALTIDGREKWHLCPQEREWVRVLHTAADGTVYLRSWTGRGVWIGSIDAGDMAQAGEKAEEQGRRGPGATTTPEAPGQGR